MTREFRWDFTRTGGTKHVGVRRDGREWEAYDRETGSRIGPLHPTRYEAQAYAEYRQRTTYADTSTGDNA